MSYKRSAVSHGATSIEVGALASRDPLVSRAALLASEIFLKMAKVPDAERLGVMRRELGRLGDGLEAPVARDMALLRARGATADQAAYDAMTAAIANRLYDRGMVELRTAIASKFGWDALLDTALGDDTARQVGCVTTGALTTIIGSIAGAYTGGAGSAAASAGGQLIGQGLDCGREQRQVERMAQQRAAEAAANLQRAQVEAQMQAARGRRRTETLLIGGGILGTIAVVALILR